ncbi:hypothetical protein EDC01DRAFT_626252 [Geopyxis carbonaria]|nr:hypothetical protein EDC01DRAFT_626252 [Geopyxis carbonaria]
MLKRYGLAVTRCINGMDGNRAQGTSLEHEDFKGDVLANIPGLLEDNLEVFKIFSVSSIGTKQLPLVSGSIGYYVQDRNNRQRVFILTCAHNVARGVPDDDECSSKKIQQLNTSLPEGTILQQPSPADRDTFLRKAQGVLDHERAVVNKLLEEEPWREGVINTIQNTCVELSRNIESLTQVDTAVGKITRFYELGSDQVSYLAMVSSK